MNALKTQHDAQSLALNALEWIAGQDNLLHVFLGSTGLVVDDLKRDASDPELLASVVDFLLMDDGWVIGFAASAGISPEDIWRARANLPGGDVPNWT